MMATSAKGEELVALRSELAQALFYVEGQPLSLRNYPMHVAIYDGHYPKILLKTGRQVASP